MHLRTTVLIALALVLHSAMAATVSTGDWRFMRTAAGLGLTAVTAGRLATKKATDPAIADFAAVLTEQHLVLNRRLGLLSLVTQVPLPSRPPAGERKALSDLKQLSGPAFDAAFVARAASVEERVVRLFRSEADSDSADPALRALAKEFLPKLQAQLRLLRDLRTQRAAPD